MSHWSSPSALLPAQGKIPAAAAAQRCNLGHGNRWKAQLTSGKPTKKNGKSHFSIGKSTISMAIFNCYVSLPEGIWNISGILVNHWLEYYIGTPPPHRLFLGKPGQTPIVLWFHLSLLFGRSMEYWRLTMWFWNVMGISWDNSPPVMVKFHGCYDWLAMYNIRSSQNGTPKKKKKTVALSISIPGQMTLPRKGKWCVPNAASTTIGKNKRSLLPILSTSLAENHYTAKTWNVITINYIMIQSPQLSTDHL